MHLVRTDQRSFDDATQAVDLEQSPADIVALSFADSDLALLASAHAQRHPSLRLAPLALLKHPYSVDLYVENVCARARFVLVRMLGGMDYWRYGVDELAAAARKHGFALAVVPGCTMEDARLDAASTLPPEDLRRLWDYFREGGPDNIAACLDFIATKISGAGSAAQPRPVAPFGLFEPGCVPAPAGSPTALALFYRSAFLAGDDAPDPRAGRGAGARKLPRPMLFRLEPQGSRRLRAAGGRACGGKARRHPQRHGVFGAARWRRRAGRGGRAGVPGHSLRRRPTNGATSRRGLSAADLAMNVVLPEVDGRIVTRAISFKREHERSDALEFAPARHEPEPSRVAFVAELAARWARLRRIANGEKKLALILSDYPAKGGRAGYAVGLDTQASARAIFARLAVEGYDATAPAPKGCSKTFKPRPLAATVSLAPIAPFWTACRRISSPRSTPAGASRTTMFPFDGAFALPFPAARQNRRRLAAGSRRGGESQGRLS